MEKTDQINIPLNLQTKAVVLDQKSSFNAPGASLHLDNTLTTAALATIISVLITCLINWFIARYNSRKNTEKALQDLIIQINSLLIQYPYFENEDYLKRYVKKKKMLNEDLRYESFCIVVFNFMERLSRFCKFDTKKMNYIFHYEEEILIHQTWWNKNIDENKRGYDSKFIEIVNKTLRGKK